MSRSFSRPPAKHVFAALGIGAALVVTAGCGAEESPEEQVYCATEDGTIVDPEQCERDNGRYNNGNGWLWYYIWHSSTYQSGLTPGARLNGGSSFRYDDATARTNLGLPSKGSITAGKGGFGTTARSTSSGKGGFGGGFGGGRSSGG